MAGNKICKLLSWMERGPQESRLESLIAP
ncbi:hypothetical protein BDI4_290036 [Burkholderia diffusa]|nr:hypothetical protein BDI4_290036 [Burkholderia diffusa]